MSLLAGVVLGGVLGLWESKVSNLRKQRYNKRASFNIGSHTGHLDECCRWLTWTGWRVEVDGHGNDQMDGTRVVWWIRGFSLTAAVHGPL